MKITDISFSELNSYKAGDSAPNIDAVYCQLDSQMPENLKKECEYRKLKLDFYHEKIESTEDVIPYYFGATEASRELENYLKQFIIMVYWDKA